MYNFQKVSERRTQLYLPEDTYKAVREEAKKQGVSMAEIIRRSIEEKIPKLKNKSRDTKKADKAWKDIMKLSGFIKGEPKDFSSNTSKYIAKMYREKV